MTSGRNKQSSVPPATAHAQARDTVTPPPEELPILPPGRFIGFPHSVAGKAAPQNGGAQSAGSFYPGGGVYTLWRQGKWRLPEDMQVDFGPAGLAQRERHKRQEPLEPSELRQPEPKPEQAPQRLHEAPQPSQDQPHTTKDEKGQGPR